MRCYQFRQRDCKFTWSIFIAWASHFWSSWKQWQKRSGYMYHVHTQKKIRIQNLRFRKIHFRERFRKAPFWGPSVFEKHRIRADTCDRFYVSGFEKLRFRKGPGTCARSLSLSGVKINYEETTAYKAEIRNKYRPLLYILKREEGPPLIWVFGHFSLCCTMV